MSGLSFLSKLVERIVAAQIRSHMESHDLGNTFQSAYKVGHSTETALFKKWLSTLSIMTHSYPVCQLGLALMDLH